MENNNSKSNNYVIKEAESIIEEFIEKRDRCNLNKYTQLEEKYNRLKILTISIGFTTAMMIFINLIFK